MSTELGGLERELINRFQGGLPVVERPFAVVAAGLGTDEATLIPALERLLTEGWLTRVGPLFNPERMGGGLTLAAMEVPQARYEAVASAVNALPTVAHNYARDHRLNMWFVVATETPDEVSATLAAIENATGLRVYDFPKRREFYLGLWLQVDDAGAALTRSPPARPHGAPCPLDAADRRIVAACQGGMPLVPQPWAAVARDADLDPAEVIARLQRMLAAGVVRRIGLVPNHYRLGFRGNGMSVWDVPGEHLDGLGRAVGALEFVSHCYQRPRHPGLWPYNLFAMVHGRDREEVRTKVHRIAELAGGRARAHDVLFSTRILKKTGLRLAA